MGKGSGSTRASSSGNPKGLSVEAQSAPSTYRISDIPADQLGYGGLTVNNSTYTKKERDAYIEKNFDKTFASVVSSKIMNGGSAKMGDVTVTVMRGPANEFGINRMNYTFSDRYGHTENAQGWSSDIEGSLRKGFEKFLKAWPQKK